MLTTYGLPNREYRAKLKRREPALSSHEATTPALSSPGQSLSHNEDDNEQHIWLLWLMCFLFCYKLPVLILDDFMYNCATQHDKTFILSLKSLIRSSTVTAIVLTSNEDSANALLTTWPPQHLLRHQHTILSSPLNRPCVLSYVLCIPAYLIDRTNRKYFWLRYLHGHTKNHDLNSSE